MQESDQELSLSSITILSEVSECSLPGCGEYMHPTGKALQYGCAAYL